MLGVEMGPGRLFSAALLAGACAAVAASAACGPGAARPTASTRGASPAASPAASASHPASRPATSRRAGTQAPVPASQVGPATGYARSVQVDAQRVISANAARSTACATRDVSGCRSALQQVAASVTALQHDLDQHPPPACLQPADASLRAALGQYQQGVQLGLKGLGDGSAGETAQAGAMMDQATSRMGTASDQLRLSSCRGSQPAVPA
jgi:hypothetical protein